MLVGGPGARPAANDDMRVRQALPHLAVMRRQVAINDAIGPRVVDVDAEAVCEHVGEVRLARDGAT